MFGIQTATACVYFFSEWTDEDSFFGHYTENFHAEVNGEKFDFIYDSEEGDRGWYDTLYVSGVCNESHECELGEDSEEPSLDADEALAFALMVASKGEKLKNFYIKDVDDSHRITPRWKEFLDFPREVVTWEKA